MSRLGIFAAVSLVLPLGCNSDIPVSATTRVPPLGITVTVTRVATHPFLARFNLKLQVNGPAGCATSSDLFPDTGGVSRRNLYLGADGRVYVIGQFDVRVFDPDSCDITLREFRSLGEHMQYVGVFDVNEARHWTFFPAAVRSEQSFERS
ncbi:MAG TPA: hypothetical protein VJ746_09685 [Nitrospira sp.]|nr:hypothetical protein [Nitrospira sp.]